MAMKSAGYRLAEAGAGERHHVVDGWLFEQNRFKRLLVLFHRIKRDVLSGSVTPNMNPAS